MSSECAYLIIISLVKYSFPQLHTMQCLILNVMWKTHLNSTSKKLYMFLQLIEKAKKLFDVATFILLRKGLVYP